jgi:transcriptional regulator with XRE-family HTH domain
MKIGDRIRYRREELEMSQDELARRLGYKSRSSINKIEKDASGLPQTKIVAIASALKTTPAYIMGWEEEIKKNPVGMAERHIEIIMDEDISDIFDDFKTLDKAQKKIVKDLVHSLAETKKAEV